MRTKYKLLDDWNGHKAGETIYEFCGNNYGCVQDDMTYGGLETKAMIASPTADAPFFTVPVQLLKLLP